MKKKPFIALAASAAMAAGLLAGCGGTGKTAQESSGAASAETPAAEAADGEAQTLTLWLPPFAGTDGEITDLDFWTEKAAAFEAENNCKVSIEITPWDGYEEKYLTGSTSDDGPDVGYLYMEMFYDYINNGMIADVDSYFTDEEKANYKYYSLGNIQGGQYGLPFVVGNPRVLIANMDILGEAGIDKVPATWEELETVGKAILEKCDGVSPLMQDWGNPHYGSLNEIYWPFFWGAGASIVDEEGNLTIDTKEGLEATEYLMKLKEEGIIPASATSNDDSLTSFKNGEAAMIYCATSNALKIDGVNWDYAPVIKGPAGDQSKTFVAADCLVMFEKCQNKELAAKLMKYLSSAEVMADFHKRVSQQPAITEDDSYTGENNKFDDMFANYSDNMQSLPVFANASGMYDSLFKNLQSMMLGEMEPAAVLSETTTYYNENLK
ncbi:ABC transporter substrate-binding protein [Lachnoclostridium sp. Marseille-P6806]|uniref:ABC transporter substrate-binding protein n=1 Tax=Lachnoclostridium sp. Marseille-P6806 TaxID=2364793 RepID=UPI00103171EE|nr:sugar ABC transporter substrate-binding protein [Lachnoclostridium sp. Marseille-P6806]